MKERMVKPAPCKPDFATRRDIRKATSKVLHDPARSKTAVLKPHNKSFRPQFDPLAEAFRDPLYVRPKVPEEVAPRVNGSHSWQVRWKLMLARSEGFDG